MKYTYKIKLNVESNKEQGAIVNILKRGLSSLESGNREVGGGNRKHCKRKKFWKVIQTFKYKSNFL